MNKVYLFVLILLSASFAGCIDDLLSDFTGSPLLDESGNYTGKLSGSAYIDPNDGAVVLTDAVESSYGHITYDIEYQDFVAEFQFWTGGGSGADAVWLFAFCNSLAEQEDWSCEGGFHFVFDEYSNTIQVWYDGARLESVSVHTDFDNGEWNRATIIYTEEGIQMFLNGEKFIDYYNDIEINNENLGGKFGFGARTGLYTNIHKVKNFLVEECDGCISENKDSGTTEKYRKMKLCYDVNDEGGNNYNYDYYYEYKIGEGTNDDGSQEGERSGSQTGPKCWIFDKPMDYIDANMRKTDCSSCTAEIYIDIELDDGYTRCDEATTTGSGTISVSCSYADYE